MHLGMSSPAVRSAAAVDRSLLAMYMCTPGEGQKYFLSACTVFAGKSSIQIHWVVLSFQKRFKATILLYLLYNRTTYVQWIPWSLWAVIIVSSSKQQRNDNRNIWLCTFCILSQEEKVYLLIKESEPMC